MGDWANFFVAVAGAAAALTGLIFVGVSISLAKVLEVPHLPNRALESIILLLTVLIVAVLSLVPGQPLLALGYEILTFGLVIWVVTLFIDAGIFRLSLPEHKKHAVTNMLFSQLSVLPYVTGGIVMVTGGKAGIYWLIPAIIFSFCKSVLDAWVLLVEINR